MSTSCALACWLLFAVAAESAAAAAAIAAERANTAAHKIEEAIMEEAAHAIAAAASSSAAAVGEDDVWQLANEAKQAEAAAAMAAIRDAIHSSSSSTDSSSVMGQMEVPSATAGVLSTAEQDDLHALIAEAIAAEAAAAAAAGLAANVEQAELVAEAVTAEAAAAAALAAADAAGAAAAADASAGQAAELVKCHICGPHADVAHHIANSSSNKVHTSSRVSVSWVLPPSDTGALEQLTALAAAAGHPAIITSTAITKSTVAAAAAAKLDSSDADAFKDEFAVSGGAERGKGAQPASPTAAAGSKNCSLADALSIASQVQMQAASATALKQAQERLVRLYRARRVAAAAAAADAAASSESYQTPPAQPSASAAGAQSTGNTHTASAGPSARSAAATAASQLGVSDLALALALAHLDAADKADGTNSSEQVVREQLVKKDTAPAATAVATKSADRPKAPAADAAQAVVKTPSAATKAGEVTITFTDSSSVSSSFDVPIIRTPGSPYSAVAQALASRPGSSSCSSSKKGADATKDSGSVKVAAGSKAHESDSSSNSFEVPVVMEDSFQGPKPSARGPSNSSNSSSSSKKFKGFGKGFSRGGRVRYYVPVDGGSSPQMFTTATAAPATTRKPAVTVTGAGTGVVQPQAMSPGDQPRASVRPDVSKAHQQQELAAGGGSIPVEWISTPNRVKRDQLHQRAAAILTADQVTEPAAAEVSAPNGNSSGQAAVPVEAGVKVNINKHGSLHFSGVASAAAALLSDEVKPGVTDLLTAAADRLDKDTSTAYGMPDIMDGSSKGAAELPPGWGSNDDKSPAANNGSSSSWGDVTSQLAAELENELAGLLTSAAARLDLGSMTVAYPMPQVPAAAEIRVAEQTAATGDDSEPFGRYVPGSKINQARAANRTGAVEGN